MLTLQLVEGEHAACWHGDRLVSMTLTSGSTGLPKAAVHSANAHLASAAGVLALMPFAAGDDWLLSLPLFLSLIHIFTLPYLYLASIFDTGQFHVSKRI